MDKESFAQRYGPVLRAYLAARWRLPTDHERVEDATQEIFLQCFKKGGALERAEPGKGGGFRAFIYGVARNIATMAERSYHRRRDSGALSKDAVEWAELEADEPSLSQVFDKAWAVMVTREARDLMARRAKDDSARRRLAALELRYQEHKPPREIADHIGQDVTQVYELLRRARQEYRVALLEIMAAYHPHAGEQELEERCVELLQVL